MSMRFESSDSGAEVESGASGPPWKLILIILLVVALLTFFLQNGERASVEFLWVDARWPLWAVIGISVVIGVVLDRLVSWQWRRSRREE